jgi:hypothetical protein
MEQIRQPVVHRRGGEHQHTRAPLRHEQREIAIANRGRVSEAMRFIHDE